MPAPVCQCRKRPATREVSRKGHALGLFCEECARAVEKTLRSLPAAPGPRVEAHGMRPRKGA